MKALMLTFLIVPAVHAQVIECPKVYPGQDTPLAEVPYRHTGKGVVTRAQLSGASMYVGDWNGRGELVGDSSKVRGGRDTRYGFEPGDVKWLVCTYGRGGEVQWWEQIAPGVTNCTLQLRGRSPMSAWLQCEVPARARAPAAR